MFFSVIYFVSLSVHLKIKSHELKLDFSVVKTVFADSISETFYISDLKSD